MRAATEGAPQAQQVADRWHLLLNGRQMVERWLTGVHARLRALPEAPNSDTAPVHRHASFPRTRSEARAREESRARRLSVYQAVRRRHLAGEPLLKNQPHLAAGARDGAQVRLRAELSRARSA